MCGFNKQMMRVLGVVALVAAPAAADEFSFGLSFGQGRGGTAIGVGFGWGNRPVVAAPIVARPVVVAPVVAQRVWVPTVQTTYRDVPVLDAWGRVISYRREAVQVQGGYWANAPQPVVATGWNSGYTTGYGYNTNLGRNGWDNDRNRNNGGHNEWRDRDDHRTGGRDNMRYPAGNNVRPMNVTRGHGR
jgi:hypothetical protein